MKPVRTVFLDADTLPCGLSFDPSTAAGIQYQSYPATRTDEVAARIAGASILITNKVRIDAELIAQAPELRLICVAAAGTDNIDLDAAAARGIAVSNMPGYANASVAEHVIAVLLMLRRQLSSYGAASIDGRWQRSAHFCWHGPRIRSLAGSTLGIVGRGQIGQASAALARALGIQVRFAESPRRANADDDWPLDRLFAESDAISLHLPLNAQTRQLVDAGRLASMKPDAVLINTGRGALLDPVALADALRRGALAGAAIDVLEHEPPSPDHPLLAPDVPNLLLTPHIAWASDSAQAALATRLVDRIRDYLAAAPD